MFISHNYHSASVKQVNLSKDYGTWEKCYVVNVKSFSYDVFEHVHHYNQENAFSAFHNHAALNRYYITPYVTLSRAFQIFEDIFN